MIDGGLHHLFIKHMPDFDWSRIETGMTSRGVPDTNYCQDGIEGWIEFKKITGFKVPMRPEQIAWSERRCRHGGRVFIAVRRTTKDQDQLYLFQGQLARALLLVGVRASLPDVLGENGPARWPWDRIRSALLT